MADHFDLTGRIALVTGASQGLGAGFAATLARAQAALAADYTPLDDLRASAAYRRRAAANLLQRFHLETRPEAPLPAQQTRAFAGVADEREAIR